MKHERIESNPAVRFGKPVIKGTRITVEQILRELGTGMTCDEVIGQHPHLTADDVRAAQIFAADYVGGWTTVYHPDENTKDSKLDHAATR